MSPHLWPLLPAWTEPSSTVTSLAHQSRCPIGWSHILAESTQRWGGKDFRSGTSSTAIPPPAPLPLRLLPPHTFGRSLRSHKIKDSLLASRIYYMVSSLAQGLTN